MGTDKGIKLNGLAKVAKHYGWGVQTVLDLARSGAIPAHRKGDKKGSRWYFYTGEIDEALKYKPKEKEATPNQSDNL